MLSFVITGLFAQTEQCDFFIRSGFDSECLLTTYRKEQGASVLHDESECVQACAGSTVKYYAMNFPAGFSCEWEVSGSDNFVVNIPGHYITVDWPEEIGVGNIILTATGPDNTICIKEMCVEIIEKPQAGIISNPLHTGYNAGGYQFIEVCHGQEIQFYSNSTGSAEAPIVGYLWEAGPDLWSTQNFTFTADYNVYGEYVKLIHIVINECGCTDQIIYEIHISKFPTLKVDCYGTACENDQVTYIADPHACAQFLWTAEGGDIVAGQTTNEITVLWNDIDDGYGYLALDGDHCYEQTCPYLTYLPIPVMTDEVDIAGPEIICRGDIVYFELPQWASTEYTWTVASMTGVTIFEELIPHKLMVRFNVPGTYTINASYVCEFLGCSGIAHQKTVVVSDPLAIIAEPDACVGESVDFATDGDPSETFTWIILDDNLNTVYTAVSNQITYTFNNAGSYSIFAENSNYCMQAEKTIIIHALPPIPQPDDSGWVTEVCPNAGYVFTAEPDDEQYYLHWEASCGTPQEFDGPEFNVTLGDPICDIHLMHVDKITGCMSLPFVHELTEFQPQTIIWDNYEVCANEIININIPTEAGVLYEWSILQPTLASLVDGQYTNSINIQANALPGTFNVVLKRSFCDQEVSETIPVVIRPIIIPAFDKINGLCQFDSGILVPSNVTTITGIWTWTIDGVSTVFTGLPADAAFNYTFNNAGDIPISLSFVADGCSQEYEIVQTFNVNPAPNISCSFTELNASDIELNATVQNPASGTYTYAWSNGSPNNITIVPNTLVLNYTCTVTNTTTGCSASQTVDRGQQPGGCTYADGAISYTLDCNTGVFTRTGNSGTAQLSWGFSNNAMQPGSLTYTGTNNEVCTAEFVNAGYYVVSSTEIIANCAYSATVEIAVPLIPDILINYNCSGTNQVQLELNNTSDYMTGVALTSVGWTIDGVPVVSPATVNSGTHLVEMQIVYTYNMQTYICNHSRTVTYLRGDANFITSPGPYCSGSPIQFTDNSTNAVSWVYDFNSQFQNLNSNNEQSFEVFGTSEDVEISLNIQDQIGCYDNFINTITVNPNGLRGTLTADNGPYCSGESWLFTFNFIAVPISTVNYLWLPTNEVGIINTRNFLQTGSYNVTLNDNNNCIYQSDFVNICFENTPYAQITGNDVYCPDEVIRLFGESGDYTYLWEGLGSSVYSTPNISFPAAALTPGIYNVTLTVSNDNCSSIDEMSVLINSAPAAPAISFGANRCLHIPPVNLQSNTSQMLFWSNGSYNSSTTTFNSGFHSAYYLHPVTGCKSDYSYLNVIKPPDFNELMTGCYTFCREDLPKSVLSPMGFFTHWEWLWNLHFLEGGNNDSPHFNGNVLDIPYFGTYNMKLEYPTGCVTMSDDLVISERENCDSCEISMRIHTPKCEIRDCHLILNFNYQIQNLSLTSTAVLTQVNVLSGTWLSPNLPVTIPINSGIGFNFFIELNNFEPLAMQLEFVFEQDGLTCTRIVTVDLAEMYADCLSTHCEGRFEEAHLNTNLSSSGMSYYDFVIQFQTGMTNVQVYSDQVTVFNYGYNSGSGVIDGLFSITPLALQALIDNHEEICFRVYGCINNEICVTEICFAASELSGGAKSGFIAPNSTSNDLVIEKHFSSDFSLHPNPAKDVLNISSSGSDFSSAIILDLTGRRVKTVSTSSVSVSDIKPGEYIIKIISKSGKCQYLKFVKQ